MSSIWASIPLSVSDWCEEAAFRSEVYQRHVSTKETQDVIGISSWQTKCERRSRYACLASCGARPACRIYQYTSTDHNCTCSLWFTKENFDSIESQAAKANDSVIYLMHDSNYWIRLPPMMDLSGGLWIPYRCNVNSFDFCSVCDELCQCSFCKWMLDGYCIGYLTIKGSPLVGWNPSSKRTAFWVYAYLEVVGLILRDSSTIQGEVDPRIIANLYNRPKFGRCQSATTVLIP